MSQVLQSYPESDKSLPARYARAIAYYRVPNIDKAVTEIDALLQERPDDPYFHALKGQMLLEHGRVAESVPEYEEAVDRKSAVSGKSVSVRVDPGGRRIIKKQKTKKNNKHT